MSDDSDTDPEDVEQRWVSEEAMEYDEQRYDLDEREHCQVCGSRFIGGSDEIGAWKNCRTCGVRVLIV